MFVGTHQLVHDFVDLFVREGLLFVEKGETDGVGLLVCTEFSPSYTSNNVTDFSNDFSVRNAVSLISLKVTFLSSNKAKSRLQKEISVAGCRLP